jgi:hypothetical protein
MVPSLLTLAAFSLLLGAAWVVIDMAPEDEFYTRLVEMALGVMTAIVLVLVLDRVMAF